MSTGRSIVTTCPARAALAGNPSDVYGGAVVAAPVPDLAAFASTEPAERFSIRAADTDLDRLLSAAARAFADAVGRPADVTLSATTTIPRSVGLGGSSALIICALRALGATIDHRFEPVELAELALSVERDRLGIAAGLQDRLVQSVGRLVSMQFDPVGYERLDPPDDLPLFVAWSTDGARTSDTVHRSLRRRYDAGDPHVITSLRGLARQAEDAAAAIADGDLERLGRAMSRTFEIRSMMVDVDITTTAMVRLAARHGAAANSAGSGGSIVGLARDRHHLAELEAAFDRYEFQTIE
jgi:galactokinase/mevalonate kinase-like predicted kinase